MMEIYINANVSDISMKREQSLEFSSLPAFFSVWAWDDKKPELDVFIISSQFKRIQDALQRRKSLFCVLYTLPLANQKKRSKPFYIWVVTNVSHFIDEST